MLRWLARRLAQLLLYAGPVPRHVAFVMDGNRRYAERQGIARLDGHSHGYKKVRRGSGRVHRSPQSR
jgi:ditrans,polycis-polyprenyl diphosphate synthase